MCNLDERFWSNNPGVFFHRVRYTPEADAWLTAKRRDLEVSLIKGNNLHPARRPLTKRAIEATSRLSFIAGLASNLEAPVGVECVQWAWDIVEHCIEFALSRTEESAAGQEQGATPASRARATVVRYAKKLREDPKFFTSRGNSVRIGLGGRVEFKAAKMRTKVAENTKLPSPMISSEIKALVENEVLCVAEGTVGNASNWLTLL